MLWGCVLHTGAGCDDVRGDQGGGAWRGRPRALQVRHSDGLAIQGAGEECTWGSVAARAPSEGSGLRAGAVVRDTGARGVLPYDSGVV